MPSPSLSYRSTPLLAAAVGLLVATHAAARDVEVDHEALLLADLLPNAGPAGELLLGNSPEPGRKRILTRRELVQRLEVARLPVPSGLPEKFTVARSAQTVSAPELEALGRAALVALLPTDAQIDRLMVPGGIVLPRGALQVVAEPSAGTWRSGRQSLRLWVQAGANTPRAVFANATLTLPKARRDVLVPRGARVTVVLSLGGVHVQAQGIAQAQGRQGDEISVLLSGASRLTRGTVRGEGLVEVMP